MPYSNLSLFGFFFWSSAATVKTEAITVLSHRRLSRHSLPTGMVTKF